MRRFIPFAIPSGTPSTVQTQTKSATITTNGGSVTVQPDSGFLLSSATVTANIPTEVKTHPTITENGSYTITPSSGKLMTKATFSVNVPTGEGLPAWIKEQSVTTYVPSSNTNSPLTVPISGLSGDPEIVIVLTSLLSPTVTRSYGGGVYANRPNEINKRTDSNEFGGVAFYRQTNGHYINISATASSITDYSSATITITPPTYSSTVCSWMAGVTYTIITLRTKTP